MVDVTRLDNQQLQRLEKRLHGIETAIKDLTETLVPTRKAEFDLDPVRKIVEDHANGSS